MAIDKWLNLAGALAGALGTILMYRGTFGLAAGSFWTDEAMLQEINRANKVRLRLQRSGLALLTASFALQGAALFTP